MQRTELHFIIDPKGNIQSIVKGLKGKGCSILIEDIKKLGQTVQESPTEEFYEKELYVQRSIPIPSKSRTLSSLLISTFIKKNQKSEPSFHKVN